ncbi:SH3 domain-containing kinase-binding protein 1 [Nasonia vitripennis]|uniref:SH3 domain-containing protein n=1 Tax=Nasonia vitripennis TaxID=7425 RepID=A0A7M7LKL8_NASVI|nr:SH3 domain-containing kinase-binding protein 1 [Nasonia vitripennis]
MEALVEYNYEAQEPDELTIRKGDIIKEIKVLSGGWWEGTLRDKRGMFPDNFVKVLVPQGGARNSAERATHEEVTLRNGSGRKYCRVLFSYEPCNDDELKLIPEEAIEYLGEVEEGWWRGRIKGRTGVFPSNFVSSPVPEETERNKQDKKELCRVLFPYDAAKEDELTLAEGDIITLLSRDAPDKGWWKGELKGQIGLFPDNFVEVITLKNDHTDGTANSISSVKSTLKQQGKRKETANVRKSLDTRNVRTDNTTIKKIPSSASTSSLSGSTTEKKSNPLISSLKRLVGDSANAASNNNGNGNGNAVAGLGEELDEVERGEGAPLSHLTASRAKAPRRRLPSTQHLRHNVPNTIPNSSNSPSVVAEENLTNGSVEPTVPQEKEDESDGLVAKTRQKAPWVEELKLNQMERRKMGTERPDKTEVKKERAFSWMPPSTNSIDVPPRPDLDGEEIKSKEKEKLKSPKSESSPPSEQPASSPVTNLPAFVPYHLYSQLLDRIAVLEEKQTTLQRKVNQLSDQLAPFIANSTSEKN